MQRASLKIAEYPYRSLKCQHLCQNRRSGSLCYHGYSIANPYFEIDIEQEDIRKALLIKQETK